MGILGTDESENYNQIQSYQYRGHC